ncbi:MAG: peptide chain release factor N(5)-glutamine methyltransferase [Bacteroidales bacterium]|nr:peptide chain release factor N(5)-glutamine methyltransferase [Bacteroidales bacterium]
MTISNFIRTLASKLEAIYGQNEALSVARIFVCDELKLTRTQIFVCMDQELDETTLDRLTEKSIHLINSEPVQYVTGIAYFHGLEFKVDNNVLIPRQETEMLVDIVCDSLQNEADACRPSSILDIGTGSGCIAVSIKKNLPEANVFAIDISEQALEIAKYNAQSNRADIYFEQYDILSKDKFPFNEKFDIIVSNPPYVRNSEKALMHKNVTDFEPSLALYVDDSDPLLFYRNILQFIARHQPDYNTTVFFEINEYLGEEMIQLCQSFGYNTKTINDLNNKSRFIKATSINADGKR